MHQRHSNSKTACPECNGFGRIVRGFGTSIRELKAMIDAGLGDLPIDTAEVECKECLGTGKRFPRPQAK